MTTRARYIMVTIWVSAALVTALVLTIRGIITDPSDGGHGAVVTAPTETAAAAPSATSLAALSTAVQTETAQAQATASGAAVVADLRVNRPVMVSPTDRLARVREYYSEAYTIGNY